MFTILLVLQSLYAHASYEAAIDKDCVRQLEALVELADQFAEAPINGGVYIKEDKELSVKDSVIAFAAAGLSAYKGEVCKLDDGLSKSSFLLSANAACSSLAQSLRAEALEFQNLKEQTRFYTAYKNLVGKSRGKAWDDCPGFDSKELEKDRIKK